MDSINFNELMNPFTGWFLGGVSMHLAWRYKRWLWAIVLGPYLIFITLLLLNTLSLSAVFADFFAVLIGQITASIFPQK
jgi:cytochrome c oxidase subunit IV